MRTGKWAARRAGRLVAAALLTAGLGATAARAATSAITDAFLAATVPAYEALHRSDDLALARGAAPRLRRFAARDDAAQADAAAALAAWGEATRQADVAAAHTPSIDGLGPLLYPFSSVIFPFRVHGAAETEPYRATLAQLAVAQGPDFDAVYLAGQSATLRRLAGVYTDYIKNGDDPGLRAIAVGNLPRVKRLLAELDRP